VRIGWCSSRLVAISLPMGGCMLRKTMRCNHCLSAG